MDAASVLREVNSWPAEERLRLVEAVWDDMAASGALPELTDAQKAELDRRLDDMDENPEDVVSWEDVQRNLRSDP